MADYSDIIFLMGAIIMFSMLTMSVNKTMMMNNMNRVSHDSNYYALSVAQEHVDDVRWIGSEADLDQYLSEFPKTVEYREDSDRDGSIPFIVDISKSTSEIENDEIRSVRLQLDIRSEYMAGGEDGNPVQLFLTKSFIK